MPKLAKIILKEATNAKRCATLLKRIASELRSGESSAMAPNTLSQGDMHTLLEAASILEKLSDDRRRSAVPA
jgi:hypothetical protein